MINCKYLFYIKAGPGAGLGHLRRCLAIAQAIGKKDRIYFIVKGDKTAIDLIKAKGIKAIKYSDLAWRLFTPIVVVIDQKDNVSREIKHLKPKGAKVCLIDNSTQARFLADIVIYPVSHLNRKLSWKGFRGKHYIGSKYFPLNPEFQHTKRIKHRSFNILVTMGGADPFKLTSKVLNALKSIKARYKAFIVIGPSFKKQAIAKDKRFIIIRNPKKIASLMSRSDIAITSFGTTLYELAYMGVPALIISNFKEEAGEIRTFEKLGTSIPLGFYKNVPKKKIADTICHLMSNKNKLLLLARHGRQLVDGKGAVRIKRLLTK